MCRIIGASYHTQCMGRCYGIHDVLCTEIYLLGIYLDVKLPTPFACHEGNTAHSEHSSTGINLTKKLSFLRTKTKSIRRLNKQLLIIILIILRNIIRTHGEMHSLLLGRIVCKL